jgi:hypothetical protein
VPLSDDYAREERIKRLRLLVTSGIKQLLVLHEAVPSYLRLALPDPESDEVPFGQRFEHPVDFQRTWDIRMGYIIAEKHHGTYTKIYKWMLAADNSTPVNLADDQFLRYRKLPRGESVAIDTRADIDIEKQIQSLAAAVEQRVDVFREQLRVDGEHEDIAVAIRDAAGGWPHLRSTGWITDSILDGYLNRMRKHRTKSEISASIGAAKEVVEATLNGMIVANPGIEVLKSTPDLADLWRALKPFIADATINDALGSKDGALIKLLSSQVATIQNLGELRNRVGTGHGKTAHPAGLQPSHALLAVDLAHTVTRFLAT